MSALRQIVDSGLLQGPTELHDKMLAAAFDGLEAEHLIIEALRDAIGALRSASRSMPPVKGEAWGSREIASIEAAIAKAEGKQP